MHQARLQLRAGLYENAESLGPRFFLYFRLNPDVWKLFQRFTFECIESGRRHFSSQGIFNRIRWYTDVETYDPASTYKINNNHSPAYARLFHMEHPQHADFFEIRRRKEDG